MFDLRFSPMSPDLMREHRNGNLWARSKMRKRHRCTICMQYIEKGSAAFRPVTEGGGTIRCDRVCSTCCEDWTL